MSIGTVISQSSLVIKHDTCFQKFDYDKHHVWSFRLYSSNITPSNFLQQYSFCQVLFTDLLPHCKCFSFQLESSPKDKGEFYFVGYFDLNEAKYSYDVQQELFTCLQQQPSNFAPLGRCHIDLQPIYDVDIQGSIYLSSLDDIPQDLVQKRTFVFQQIVDPKQCCYGPFTFGPTGFNKVFYK